MQAAWAAPACRSRAPPPPKPRRRPVPGLDQLSPGDLLFIPGEGGTAANPGHVGMYVGAAGRGAYDKHPRRHPRRLTAWTPKIVAIRRVTPTAPTPTGSGADPQIGSVTWRARSLRPPSGTWSRSGCCRRARRAGHRVRRPRPRRRRDHGVARRRILPAPSGTWVADALAVLMAPGHPGEAFGPPWTGKVGRADAAVLTAPRCCWTPERLRGCDRGAAVAAYGPAPRSRHRKDIHEELSLAAARRPRNGPPRLYLSS